MTAPVTAGMKVVLAAGATLLLAAVPAGARDVAAGRRVAVQVCQSCHGLDGLAKLPEAPHLAAQDAAYLSRQLHAYKSGERKNEQMTVVAEELTPEQIENVAAYYNAIEIEVVKLPGR